jgi:hypothetical protein
MDFARPFHELWLDALTQKECEGYYALSPCLAQSCCDGDSYCVWHQALEDALRASEQIIAAEAWAGMQILNGDT